MRRLLCTLAAALLCLPLAACWDYKGLDTLDIVSGVAIDRDTQTGAYIVTMEIIDTQSGAPGAGMSARYTEGRGDTIFDAVRNSKKRLTNRLYSGNAMTLIISHQIARDEGILLTLELFLRNGEPRETLNVAISQQATAREILMAQGIDSKITAMEIHDMIIEDNVVTASTKSIDMYQVYEQIQSPGCALVLPALHTTDNNGQTVAETNGIALFRGDRLIGFDTPQNARYYLFVMGEVQGGVHSLPIDGGEAHAAFEITGSRTRARVTVTEGQAHISLNIKVTLNAAELKRQMEVLQAAGRQEAQAMVGAALAGQIADYIRTVQTDVGVDIFGLGRQLYQRQPDLWRQLEHQWDSLFQRARVTVEVEAELLGFGVIKQF